VRKPVILKESPKELLAVKRPDEKSLGIAVLSPQVSRAQR
jgi:hypothetical protein